MIALIVAMDKKGLIGKDNALPWHFPKDLKHFKQKTLNHTVVMGRKTYESIVASLGKPLPNRDNIVLTTQKRTFKGARVIHDLESYLKTIPKDHRLFIIGGRKVYEAALPHADVLYITHVDGEYEGDTFFPEVDYSQYRLVNKVEDPPLTFATYLRKGTDYDHRTL